MFNRIAIECKFKLLGKPVVNFDGAKSLDQRLNNFLEDNFQLHETAKT